MNRRLFTQLLTAAAFSGRLLRRARHTCLGLELYSVRDEMRRDPEATLAKVRAIGYDYVELLWSFDNFGRTPKQVRASLDREGLYAPSAHMAPETILGDWNRRLDDAKLLGHEHLIVPSLPADTNTSLDAWRLWADRFNEAGAVARKAGIWLAFHNEPIHQTPIDGRVPYDLFLERTDPGVVAQQLDVGNLVMGGGDPFLYLQKHGSRYTSFHLKDVVADRKTDTELGKGTLNFQRIVNSIEDIDLKTFYVEQENAPEPLVSARRNYEYLRSIDL
jgi:sugar phosphate isomerase/epimerase